MKTTLDLSDDLLQRAKAAAALKGESLKELFTAALSDHLARLGGTAPGVEGWRKVVGRAKRSQVEKVDVAVANDLELIDLESWR